MQSVTQGAKQMALPAIGKRAISTSNNAMPEEKPAVETIDISQLRSKSVSLKQQLVAAVANGDELAADELRRLLKINSPENLRSREPRR